MYIIPIGWLYVALMMSVAEANNSNGTVLGACITFVLYGLLPVGLVLYILGTPARKRRLQARTEAERQAALARAGAAHAPAPAPAPGPAPTSDSVSEPDAGHHAPTDAVAAVGKEA